MKKIIPFTILLVFAFSSCKKEETNKTVFNEMTYNGMTFNLGSACTMIKNLDGTYNLYIYSSSIVWNDNTYKHEGIGDIISIHLNVINRVTFIIEGDYEYNPENTSENSIWASSFVCFNRNLNNTSDSYTYSYINGGDLSLNYNESKELYTAEFEFIIGDDQKLKGSFEGIYVYNEIPSVR